MKGKAKKGTMKRLLKSLFSFYPVLLPVTIVCISVAAIVSTLPSIFMQNIIAIITESLDKGFSWADVSADVFGFISILLFLYVFSLTAGFTWNQLMAVITQGTLKKFRDKMFKKMQALPVKYFDSHNHGDIMSYYTNDIDTMRQLISQSLPQLIMSGITVTSLVIIMLYFSLWMTLVVLVGVIAMLIVTGKIGGGSARHFVRQQVAIGKTEGFIEEIINGQKRSPFL
jgi:ATP-binding cassette subfamily B protein